MENSTSFFARNYSKGTKQEWVYSDLQKVVRFAITSSAQGYEEAEVE